MRLEKDKDLAMIEAKMMMPCIRRGIAPRMKCDPNETYWGHKVPGAGTAIEKLMGIEPVNANSSYEEARNKDLENISCGGRLNARQAIEKLKGAFALGLKPEFPQDVQQETPQMINTYTDGGVIHPKVKWLSLGGFGIWTPEDDECEQDGDIHFTHSRKEGGGTMQWAAMPGQRCTSTRVETAAALISLIRNKHST